MSAPEEIPDGAMIKCSCGVTVADLSAWKGHASTHEGEPDWYYINASDGARYEE